MARFFTFDQVNNYVKILFRVKFIGQKVGFYTGVM